MATKISDFSMTDKLNPVNQYCGVYAADGVTLIVWDMNDGLLIDAANQLGIAMSSLKPHFDDLKTFFNARQIHKYAKVDKVEYQFYRDALSTNNPMIAGMELYSHYDKYHCKVVKNASMDPVPSSVRIASTTGQDGRTRTWLNDNRGHMLSHATGKSISVKMAAKVRQEITYRNNYAPTGEQVEPTIKKMPWVLASQSALNYPSIGGVNVYMPLIIIRPNTTVDFTGTDPADEKLRQDYSNKFRWYVRAKVHWSVKGRYLTPLPAVVPPYEMDDGKDGGEQARGTSCPEPPILDSFNA